MNGDCGIQPASARYSQFEVPLRHPASRVCVGLPSANPGGWCPSADDNQFSPTPSSVWSTLPGARAHQESSNVSSADRRVRGRKHESPFNRISVDCAFRVLGTRGGECEVRDIRSLSVGFIQSNQNRRCLDPFH